MIRADPRRTKKSTQVNYNGRKKKFLKWEIINLTGNVGDLKEENLKILLRKQRKFELIKDTTYT